MATAFSSHRFEETFDRIAPNARWTAVGQGVFDGREAIIAACRSTAEMLSGTSTEFTRFLVVAGTDAVAIDVIAHYDGAGDDKSVVSSCDIYEFNDDLIVAITSYAAEIS
ncbi:nuclear transport factor 2 family protein [Kribbella sp. NPDC051952]|uniref:nuclear transport factor 2 family protein n=1 Tax=Kribbella sp. NPDC051952 TaxID=3154851 RepID=UPI003422471D